MISFLYLFNQRKARFVQSNSDQSAGTAQGQRYPELWIQTARLSLFNNWVRIRFGISRVDTVCPSFFSIRVKRDPLFIFDGQIVIQITSPIPGHPLTYICSSYNVHTRKRISSRL